MTTERKTYASPRQLERQQRVLACARVAISKVGYDRLTMKDLAESSEVSTKTLYNLYNSKDELLVAAVADLLADLAEQHDVVAAEPGIARMLARVSAISAQVVATPAYAETMARTLFQASKDNDLIEVLLKNARLTVLSQLREAEKAGELQPGVDLEQTATVLTGHQWSVVLMWNKGLIPLKEFEEQAQRSQLMSLIPITNDVTQKNLLAALSNTRARN